ncbi:MAG: ABC transporter permease, partial [Acidobacteriota bacterium]|nr:ABC transporter permease [Acidobacteriota bacterium]
MKLIRSARLLRLALRSFRRSPVRSILAISAAAGGTAGLIACMGYAAAGREKVFDQFRRMGSNLLVVTPLQSRAVGGRARTGAPVTTLREPDYRALLSSVPDIAASSPTVSTVLRIRAGDLTKQTTIVGCKPAWFAIRDWNASSGALFTAADDRAARRVALLGATVARELFGSADPTGQRIAINRVPFAVGGVLRERGQGLDASDEDAQVYVPLRTAMLRLMNVEYYSSIVLQVESRQRLDNDALAVQTILARRHRFADPTGPDFQVQNQKSLIDAQLATLARMTFLLQSIAASMLLVGSMGIFGVTWIGIGHRVR